MGLAINNHGVVTGNPAVTGVAGVHAYIGNSAGLTDIGTLVRYRLVVVRASFVPMVKRDP